MINILKIVHNSNRVHNDLKPENVMIQTLEDGSTQAYIIDYGFASKFCDGDKNHIAVDASVDLFQGNINFSSLRQMKFLQTSRKDDLVSLFYMMIFLLNDN